MIECKECGEYLEEWEVGLICEGCSIRVEARWEQGGKDNGEE